MRPQDVIIAFTVVACVAVATHHAVAHTAEPPRFVKPEKPPESIEELRKAIQPPPVLVSMTPGPISSTLLERYQPQLLEAGMDEDTFADLWASYRKAFAEIDRRDLQRNGEAAAASAIHRDEAADYADAYESWFVARNDVMATIEATDGSFFTDLATPAESATHIMVVERFRRDRQRERCMALARIGVGTNVDVHRLTAHLLAESAADLTDDARGSVEQTLEDYRERHRDAICRFARAIEQFMYDENVVLRRFGSTSGLPEADIVDAQQHVIDSKREVLRATTPIWRLHRETIESLALVLPAEAAWRLRAAYFEAVGDRASFPDRADIMPVFLAARTLDNCTDEQVDLLALLEAEYARQWASVNYRLIEGHLRYKEQVFAPSTLATDHAAALAPIQRLLEHRQSIAARTLESIEHVLDAAQLEHLRDTIDPIREALEASSPRVPSFGPVFH